MFARRSLAAFDPEYQSGQEAEKRRQQQQREWLDQQERERETLRGTGGRGGMGVRERRDGMLGDQEYQDFEARRVARFKANLIRRIAENWSSVSQFDRAEADSLAQEDPEFAAALAEAVRLRDEAEAAREEARAKVMLGEAEQRAREEREAVARRWGPGGGAEGYEGSLEAARAAARARQQARSTGASPETKGNAVAPQASRDPKASVADSAESAPAHRTATGEEEAPPPVVRARGAFPPPGQSRSAAWGQPAAQPSPQIGQTAAPVQLVQAVPMPVAQVAPVAYPVAPTAPAADFSALLQELRLQRELFLRERESRPSDGKGPGAQDPAVQGFLADMQRKIDSLIEENRRREEREEREQREEAERARKAELQAAEAEREAREAREAQATQAAQHLPEARALPPSPASLPPPPPPPPPNVWAYSLASLADLGGVEALRRRNAERLAKVKVIDTELLL